jgi:hypothetical protein
VVVDYPARRIAPGAESRWQEIADPGPLKVVAREMDCLMALSRSIGP